MLNSKFDLYKSGWLELVFAKRNKEYGAYYLRQHNSQNMAKAMGITFFGVAIAITAFSIVLKHKPEATFKQTVFTVDPLIIPPAVKPPKKTATVKPAGAKASAPTKQFIEMTPAPGPVAVDPPKLSELKGNIGPKTIDIPDDGKGIAIDGSGEKGGDGAGAGEAIKDDENVHTTAGLDVMPEPYGGAAAWAKFLQKNIHYPNEALQNGVSGKVWVTFVVEKNGHLSSFTIEKGVGYGTDEESLRVLKMAAPWKPGIQNGQPVRVRYTLPLNFLLDQ